jgi:hypothetical protein
MLFLHMVVHLGRSQGPRARRRDAELFELDAERALIAREDQGAIFSQDLVALHPRFLDGKLERTT